jgi:hypothetical protein
MIHRGKTELPKGDLLELAIGRVLVNALRIASVAISMAQGRRMVISLMGKRIKRSPGKGTHLLHRRPNRCAQTGFEVNPHQGLQLFVDLKAINRALLDERFKTRKLRRPPEFARIVVMTRGVDSGLLLKRGGMTHIDDL